MTNSADEAKKSGQDKSSAGKPGDTSGKKTPTFTAEQEKVIAAREEKARSDALAKAGRTSKALEARESVLKKEQDAQATRIAEEGKKAEARRRREREEHQGDNEALSIIDQKHQNEIDAEANRKEREANERDKANNAAEIEAASSAKREILIFDVSHEDGIGLEPSNLKKFCDDLNLTTEEQIRTAAKNLASGKPPEGDGKKAPGGDGKKPGEDGFQAPDSGTTEGGGRSEEDALKERYPTM